MKKDLRKEKGSAAVFVIATILFFLIFGTGIYMVTSTLRQSQLKSDVAVKEVYEKELQQADQIYEKIVNANIIYQEEFNDWNNYLTVSTTVNSCKDGVLNITSTNEKSSILLNQGLSFKPQEHRYLQITYKVNGTTANKMAFYSVENPSNQDYYIQKDLICDNNWHTIIFDLWENEKIKQQEEITNLKWEWCNVSGTNMEIDHIKIF